jgi:hypothetical protein
MDSVLRIENSNWALLIGSETNFFNNYRRGPAQLFTLLHETKIENVMFLNPMCRAKQKPLTD